MLSDGEHTEVPQLLPDTRYTVSVSLGGFESRELELRTAAASSCQFTLEDWGSTYVEKLTGDKVRLFVEHVGAISRGNLVE